MKTLLDLRNDMSRTVARARQRTAIYDAILVLVDDLKNLALPQERDRHFEDLRQLLNEYRSLKEAT